MKHSSAKRIRYRLALIEAPGVAKWWLKSMSPDCIEAKRMINPLTRHRQTHGLD